MPTLGEGLEESFERMLMNIDVSDDQKELQNGSAEVGAGDFGTDEQE